MLKNFRKILLGLAACSMLAGCQGCGKYNGNPEGGDANSGSGERTTFVYAENQAEDYPTSMGAYKFAQLVSEKTGGRIEILVQAGGTLGDEKSVIEQMQFGGVDFARVSLSPLAEYIPKLNVLQMPYLYQNSEQMWKVLDGEIGEDFKESFEGSGLVALSWYDAGARNFYNSKREIHRLEDMKGLKIRIQESELMKDMVEALGALPVPMAYEEVYSGLQTGMIDGAENNWASYESTGHDQVAKYYTVDEHARVPEVQLASKIVWDTLSAGDREIVKSCAEESAEYERRLWAQREEKARTDMEKAGCSITEPDAEELARFKAAVEPLYDKYCGEYSDIIAAIKEKK